MRARSIERSRTSSPTPSGTRHRMARSTSPSGLTTTAPRCWPYATRAVASPSPTCRTSSTSAGAAPGLAHPGPTKAPASGWRSFKATLTPTAAPSPCRTSLAAASSRSGSRWRPESDGARFLLRLDLGGPRSVLAGCPRAVDVTLAHARTCFGVATGHEDVPDYDDEDPESRPVVHECRARAPRDRPPLVLPHDDSGSEQHQDRAQHECRVELLASIELADADPPGAAVLGTQPAPVARREAVQSPYVVTKCRRQQQSQQDGQRQQQSAHDVDARHDEPPAHELAHERRRQHGCCDETHREKHSDASVD